MRKLLLVALLALLVTGGIAAVYRGPFHPQGEDANAAVKAARTKSHVVFDPSDYADGKPVPESFLTTFHFDLAYWRSRLLPGNSSEPIHDVAVTETPSRASKTELPTPDPSRAITKPPTQQPQPHPKPLTSGDTGDPMSEAFLMAGIPPALANQTALRTGSFAAALSPVAPPPAAGQNLDQNSIYGALSHSFSEIFSASSILQMAPAAPSIAGVGPNLYRSVSWTRYFVLSPAASHFLQIPEDDAQSIPDPFLAYPAASKELNPSSSLTRRGDANLGLRSVAPDPTPEPRTLILCGLTLTLLWWRRSHSA